MKWTQFLLSRLGEIKCGIRNWFKKIKILFFRAVFGLKQNLKEVHRDCFPYTLFLHKCITSPTISISHQNLLQLMRVHCHITVTQGPGLYIRVHSWSYMDLDMLRTWPSMDIITAVSYRIFSLHLKTSVLQLFIPSHHPPPATDNQWSFTVSMVSPL